MSWARHAAPRTKNGPSNQHKKIRIVNTGPGSSHVRKGARYETAQAQQEPIIAIVIVLQSKSQSMEPL